MVYIERLVLIKDKLESDRLLQKGDRVTILLAEPGAGKETARLGVRGFVQEWRTASGDHEDYIHAIAL